MRLHVLLGILILNIAAFAAGQRSKDVISVTKIIEGAAQFSGKFVKQVAKMDRKNFAVSPLGAYLALTMASFGARRHTEDVFDDALGLVGSPSDNKRTGVELTNMFLNSFNASELRVANGIFVSSKIDLFNDFIETTTNVGRSPVQKANFNKPVEASNSINNWSKLQTNNHVEDIVDSAHLDPSTLIALASAAHFDGTLMKELRLPAQDLIFGNDKFTFENGGTTQSIPFVEGTHKVKYGEHQELGFKFIEIPYKVDATFHSMSMFIIVPKNGISLANLEENFDKISIQDLLQRGTIKELPIAVPKFRINKALELKDALKRMGLGHIFEQKRADFSGIFSPNNYCSRNVFVPDMAINTFVQKVSVEMNGRGIEYVVDIDPYYSMDSFSVRSPFYIIIASTSSFPTNILTVRFTGEE